MTEKRFQLNKDCEWWFVKDNTIKVNEYGYRDDLTGEDIYRSLKQELTEEETVELLNELAEENQQLIQHIKKLEKQLYLVHMSSMFSTVRSFKGDVSKRYYYSEKTDRVYDTANTYGQYDKILEKKEIAMLLNEYETLLNGGDVNDKE